MSFSFLGNLWDSAFPYTAPAGASPLSPTAQRTAGFLQNNGLSTALSGVSSLANLYYGNQAMKLAKQQQRTADAYNAVNLSNQANITNAAMQADYTNNYLNATPERRAAMASIEDYMARNRVKGTI